MELGIKWHTSFTISRLLKHANVLKPKIPQASVERLQATKAKLKDFGVKPLGSVTC